jgi:hypothetical protein
MRAIEELAQTVRVAVDTWQGTVRLCLVMLSGAVAGAVFLVVLAAFGLYR